jgi:FKBP-type peptidyl-prolyl cis-trans isomerase FkpA
MDTRSRKNSPSSDQPGAVKSASASTGVGANVATSPGGKGLLWLSFAANLLLAGALVFAFSKRSSQNDLAESSRAAPASPAPAVATAPAAPAASATAVNPLAGDAPLSRDLRPYAALGTFVAENNHIPELQWTEAQFAAFQQGLRSTFEGRGYPVDEEAVKLRDDISRKVQAMLDAKKSDPIEDYFRTLREKENVQRTPSGLHYRITEQASGDKPTADATVVVSYAGRLPDGRSLPILTRARVRTPVKDLLPGLAEGVQLLSAGGKALVYLPPSLSFRNGPWPAGIPQGAPIIVFLELHDVNPWE